MPESHEHHDMVAHPVTAVTGGVEEALHFRLGEEVFPAVIDSRAFAFYPPF
jgi:hypothetical protein